MKVLTDTESDKLSILMVQTVFVKYPYSPLKECSALSGAVFVIIHIQIYSLVCIQAVVYVLYKDVFRMGFFDVPCFPGSFSCCQHSNHNQLEKPVTKG